MHTLAFSCPPSFPSPPAYLDEVLPAVWDVLRKRLPGLRGIHYPSGMLTANGWTALRLPRDPRGLIVLDESSLSA